MADKNTVDIGFEQQIREAADILCGNMDAEGYLRLKKPRSKGGMMREQRTCIQNESIRRLSDVHPESGA